MPKNLPKSKISEFWPGIGFRPKNRPPNVKLTKEHAQVAEMTKIDFFGKIDFSIIWGFWGLCLGGLLGG